MITINSEKINNFLNENSKSKTMKNIIKAYENLINANSFSDITCPCCKQKGKMILHKRYKRHLTYMENGEIINDIINIGVLVCNNCKNNDKQKYHSLLPDFILPYQIYEASFIISSIYERKIKKEKIKEIIEQRKITHKLFYDWLRKFKKYIMPAAVILKVENVENVIIDEIYKINQKFLINFYQQYNHPYFLFKATCTPLVIKI